jgi:hypothetical protein
VHQTAEAISPPNAIGDRDSGRRESGANAHRRAKRKASVRPLVVVVPHLLVEDPLEVASAPDQQPVQALLPDGQYPALGDRVGVRRLDRGRDDLNAVGGEDVVKGAGNLVSRSRSRNRCAVTSSAPSVSIENARARWTTKVRSDGR